MILSPKQIDWTKEFLHDPKVLLWAREYQKSIYGKIPTLLHAHNTGNTDGYRAFTPGENIEAGYYEVLNLDFAWKTSKTVRYFYITGELTILSWLKASSDITDTRIIIRHGTSGETEATNVNYEFSIIDTNALKFFYEYGDGNNVSIQCSNNTFLADNKYHLYSVRRIKENGTYKVEFRRDLTLLNTFTGLNPATGGWEGWLAIGNMNWTSTPDTAYNFPGYIGQIIIYNGNLPFYKEAAFYHLTRETYEV